MQATESEDTEYCSVFVYFRNGESIVRNCTSRAQACRVAPGKDVIYAAIVGRVDGIAGVVETLIGDNYVSARRGSPLYLAYEMANLYAQENL